MLLYVIVFSTALAGLAGAPWWAAVIGGCVLALHLIAEDKRDAARFGEAIVWAKAQTLSSVTIASVAAPVAFGAGMVSRAIM